MIFYSWLFEILEELLFVGGVGGLDFAAQPQAAVVDKFALTLEQEADGRD